MKLGLTLMAAVLILAVLVVLNVRAYVEGERDEPVARGERALGRALHVGAVGASWWPLGVRMSDVSVDDDAAFGGGTLATIPAVIVPIRLWALATGTIEAAGLRLEAPRLHLTRDEHRRWNIAPLGRSESKSARGDGRDGALRVPFELPLEWVIGIARARIDGGTIEIEDRAGPSPRHLTIDELRVRASDLRFGADALVVVDAVVRGDATIGNAHAAVHVPGAGENELAHTPFDATIALRDVEVGALAALAGFGASGRIDEINAQMRGTSTRLETALAARTSAESARRGTRPILPAQALALQARVVSSRGRINVDDGQLAVGSLSLTLTGGATLDSGQAELHLRSVDGARIALPLGEPPLEAGEIRADGSIADGRAKITAALRVGEIPVEVAATLIGVAPWTGDASFEAKPFGGTAHADVRLDAAAFSTRVRLEDVDVGDALARFAPALADVIDGTATGTATFGGPIAAGVVVGDSITGAGELTVTDGRLRGVNVADQVLGPVTGVSLLPRLLSSRARARYEHVFGTDDTVVTRARVPFTLADRRVVIDDGRLESETFDIVGGGWLSAEHEMRFQGDLVLSAPLSASLADEVRAIALLRGADGRVVVPFRVRGDLGRARPEVDAKRLRARGLTALFTRGAETDPPLLPDPGARPGAPPLDEPASDRGDAPRVRGRVRDLRDRVGRILRP